VKGHLVHAIVFLMAIVFAIQPAMADTIHAIPFYTTDCAMFIQPTCITTVTITEFHQANTSCVSLEKLDIDFPAFSGLPASTVLGPTMGTVSADGLSLGAGSSANVIPFGPVDLALPSIRQTTDDIASCQRTYFFSDVST
jgi:hypothetical protein